MTGAAKYVWAALIVAVLGHLAIIHAAPRVLMGAALNRLGADGFNTWRFAPRVTAESRSIVRPSPDFAYSACAYDLGDGPIQISVAPWDGYWSLSLYAANSDNFHVIDDREARQGATITLARRVPSDAVESGAVFVSSPSTRGVALIRRLAPTPDAYDAAALVARGDVCAPVAN